MHLSRRDGEDPGNNALTSGPVGPLQTLPSSEGSSVIAPLLLDHSQGLGPQNPLPKNPDPTASLCGSYSASILPTPGAWGSTLRPREPGLGTEGGQVALQILLPTTVRAAEQQEREKIV